MATEEKKENKEEEVQVIKIAKRHSLLLEISRQLNGNKLSRDVEVGGHRYHMTTLDADEETWSDGFIQTSSTAQAISSYRKARLAAAIKRIDGIPVEELFQYPDNMSDDETLLFKTDRFGKRTWLMTQLMLWLGELPMNIIDELGKEFSSMNTDFNESLANLKKSSAGTSGGKSKVTSSPEKESSQATQM